MFKSRYVFRRSNFVRRSCQLSIFKLSNYSNCQNSPTAEDQMFKLFKRLKFHTFKTSNNLQLLPPPQKKNKQKTHTHTHDVVFYVVRSSYITTYVVYYVVVYYVVDYYVVVVYYARTSMFPGLAAAEGRRPPRRRSRRSFFVRKRS